MTQHENITLILERARNGSNEDYNKLFSMVYDQLKEIAMMRINLEHNEITYSRTDLVHEAYIRLFDANEIKWQDTAHFNAVASRCMRRILIDHARKKKADKRGGNKTAITYIDELMRVHEQADKLISLDDTLKELGKLNQRLVDIVECRYFGEMSIEDTAEALNISVSTVKRDWAKARGWLYKELNDRF
ncbi:ECF-type sigma factor [Balneola sp. MJW-20]|uniref:ECF-type sigma factor n=1 Tax=Gracilimonas aurantiaca TaxID=3234185 RepID=UPI003465CD94